VQAVTVQLPADMSARLIQYRDRLSAKRDERLRVRTLLLAGDGAARHCLLDPLDPTFIHYTYLYPIETTAVSQQRVSMNLTVLTT